MGLDLDRWMTIQSTEQPRKIPARCHDFEKEWTECAHGIGSIRAAEECEIEMHGFKECLLREKDPHLNAIRRQKDKLIKARKYALPPHLSGQDGPRP
ncbi:NADH dehydrogenase [ubiquinone] iron-sulfur protein 5 [Galemys pyrenaicus]|uniref:NADH dehydrogenase [ubiquinone] iron-sulfur protein 5 n=1 Tax=Galemys pyrenaicus TaxID=202257 RepID=A0A8J6ADH4_GALPY|nr:NADH dehydrogenase [ubiquinone] iron-sulfur protein 5 [Galemys pyrenaicus]